MKRRMYLAASCVWAIAAMAMLVPVADAEDVAPVPEAKAMELTGRFVTMTVQDIGERSYTGLLIALPEGAGLVTLLVEPGLEGDKLTEEAGKPEAGQRVRVTYVERDSQKWAKGLTVVGDEPGKAAGDAGAVPGADAPATLPGAGAVDQEFADADSRARAKIRQLEQRVAELEAEIRQMREAQADAAKAAAEAKDKPDAPKLLTGTSAGRVEQLIQRNVDGKKLPAVVVTTDNGPAVFVVPLVENDKGEKGYDPAVRTVMESLKVGQQVRIVWQTDGKEKMIKTIEAVPDRPMWPRRRGG